MSAGFPPELLLYSARNNNIMGYFDICQELEDGSVITINSTTVYDKDESGADFSFLHLVSETSEGEEEEKEEREREEKKEEKKEERKEKKEEKKEERDEENEAEFQSTSNEIFE